jgi:2-hydroxy-3-oxopropionate reductase
MSTNGFDVSNSRVYRVGVVGLGVMGNAIATRLLREHGDLVVHDLRRHVASDLVEAGAEYCGAAAEVAERCDVIVLSLNTAHVVEEVVFGEGGVVSGWGVGEDGLILDMSSIAPDRTREFARRAADLGHAWVDAPLSGGAPGALAGRLTIMAGGDGAAVSRANTVLNHLASKVTHVGDCGAGQFVKLINQVLVGIGFSALAEAAAMSRAAHLDPQTVLSAITGGRADSPLFQEFFIKFATTDLTPTGNIGNMVKDLGTAIAAAHSEKLTMPLTELVLAQNQELVAQGYGLQDNANLMRLYGPIKQCSSPADKYDTKPRS